MNFSLSTVLNTLVGSSLFAAIAVLLICRCATNRRIKLYTVFFLCAAAMLRLFLPFEFSFTHSFYIPNLWYGLHAFLNHHYAQISHIRIDYMHLLPILWFAGASVKLLFSFYSWKKTMRTIKSLPKSGNRTALQALNECNAAFQKPVPVRLLTSPDISGPLIVGVRTPVIIIPDLELTQSEWSFIFRHELSHYYRGHMLFRIFFELLTDLYFWNPLLYLLKKQFYRLLEFSADEEAVSPLSLLHRISYSECLLKVMKSRSKVPPAVHTYGISFGSSGFADRIKRIINTEPSPNASRINRAILAGTAILFLFSYMVILEPEYETPPSEAEDSFTMDASDSYYRPNGDGTYDVIHDGQFLFTTSCIFDEAIPIKEDEAP